ncbi:MAG: hypothetical protein HY532_03490 [Chloroflexi bacterium]|nr:hypothetical protein [Chloroflexota bacterium]
MGWVIIGILAVVYLLIRFVQMGHFIVVRFFLNSAIALSIKAVAVVLIVLAIWGIWRWWRWYLHKSDAPKREGINGPRG